jgi:hypothetical protein
MLKVQGAILIRWCLCGIGQPERQLKLSALQLVAVDQHGRLDRLPVDVSAVEAAEVDDSNSAVRPPQLCVVATHRDLIEEDVAAGMAAYRRHRLSNQESGSSVRTPFDYQLRALG